MSAPHTRKPVANPPATFDAMKEFVIPSLELEASPAEDELTYELNEADPDSGNESSIVALLRGEHVVHVTASPLDDQRTNLRFSMMSGYLIQDCPSDAMLVGTLLEPTAFHVRADLQLGLQGQLQVGCDLMVRPDDAWLVQQRLAELLQLAKDFRWLLCLRMPHHLHWQEIVDTEIEWDELPHEDLSGFLDNGLSAPKGERTPYALLRIAQGLGRWNDVLKLLREHPEELPGKTWAPMKCLAYGQLQRWIPAIRAAKEGGIKDGRYPDIEHLSPAYMNALIRGGDDIEALRLLGEPKEGEPAFYQWMRGLALHNAGGHEQAAEAFNDYFSAWPNDILARATVIELQPDEG